MPTDWPNVLASPPADLVLVHEVGDAWAPDAGGRFALEVRAGGPHPGGVVGGPHPGVVVGGPHPGVVVGGPHPGGVVGGPHPGGRLAITRSIGDVEERWTARCSPGVVRALLDGFAAVGFPDVPWHDVPPGPSVRVLGAWFGEVGEGDGADAICARSELERDPAFARLFALCDGLVAQVAPGGPGGTDPDAIAAARAAWPVSDVVSAR